MNSAYFTAKRSVGIGCDLDSSPEWVARENLPHFFGNWNTELLINELQILQA